jgi:hypothetical protein
VGVTTVYDIEGRFWIGFGNCADHSVDSMAESNRKLEKNCIMCGFVNCTCHQILL